MVISDKNQHVAPYWGKEPALTAGLNQLGIRNVSEELFSLMLPGLNNVSRRVRYYSFYCWLIMRFYSDRTSIIDTDFYPYVRRAELLLALINATLENREGIPGINFAAVKVDSGIESFSLKDGADIEPGKRTYWKAPGGILRQYYSASLEEIGLIGQNEKYNNIFNVTKEQGYINGLSLANDFATTVGDKGELFLAIIERGSVTSKELSELNGAFGMKQMSVGSKERDSLQDMLLQPDAPYSQCSSIHRRTTIRLVLEYLHHHKCALEAIGFSSYIYEKFKSDRNLTVWGWYAYYLDDNWQYQFTIIFHEILCALQSADKQWTPVDQLSRQMAAKVIDAFQITAETTVGDLVKSLGDAPLNDPTAEAIRCLLVHHRDNIDELSNSKLHYKELGIRADNFCDFMQNVEHSTSTPVFAFTAQLIEDIVYRHYRVSFRKMLQTQKATQKFALENGCLRFIDNWAATNTSPRIDTIRNFLIDLSIIDVQDGIDVLTDLGANLLKDLTDGNTAA